MMKFAQLSFALAVTATTTTTVPTDKMYKTKSGDCKFPFIYKDKEYNECTKAGSLYGKRSWCSTKVNEEDNKSYISGEWGYCLPNPAMECKDYSNNENDCLQAGTARYNFHKCRWNTWNDSCVDCDIDPATVSSHLRNYFVITCRDVLQR